MNVEFDIKIIDKDIRAFLLRHNYLSMQGILSLLIGVLAIVAGIVTFGDVEKMYSVLYFALGVIIIIYMPISVSLKAKQQYLSTPVFKEPIHYAANAESITSSVNEEAMEVKWANVFKVVSTSKHLLVYTTKVNASIIPIDQVGDKYGDLVKVIRDNVPAVKVKIK